MAIDRIGLFKRRRMRVRNKLRKINKDIRGVFATDDIYKGEELLFVPLS